MNILYEDNHLLVVEKPVNMPVQADSSGDADLLSLLKAYIKQKYNKPGEAFLGLVHRLDRPVGGVMVFARTSKAASRLAAQFGGNGAQKRYAALTRGSPLPRAKLEGFLLREEAEGPRGGSSCMAAEGEPGAKRAAFSYSPLSEHEGLTLMDIALYTGRHHQIRVQLANAGLPLFGDQRYNPAAVPGEQIALWAYSLTLEHPTLHRSMTFKSLPAGGAWAAFGPELAALAEGAPIVWRDDNLLACDKPAGLSVAEEDGGDSLEARLNRALGRVYPVHRLDVATRGLVLFARSETARDALNQAIRARTIRKFYHCRVWGDPGSAPRELHAYLEKDEAAARVRVFDAPRPGANAKEIVTRCRALSRGAESSLLEVELVTGRTHQIRAHLAHEGFPLLGDDRYGDRERDRRAGVRALALEAVRLELFFPKGSALAYLNGTILSLEV